MSDAGTRENSQARTGPAGHRRGGNGQKRNKPHLLEVQQVGHQDRGEMTANQLAMTDLINSAALETAIQQLVAEYQTSIDYAASIGDLWHPAQLKEQAMQEMYAAGLRRAMTVIVEHLDGNGRIHGKGKGK